MKICGFTQTYGDRSLELDVTLMNDSKILLMKNLDHFRLNYHNSNLNQKYNSIFQEKINNISFRNFDNVPYGYTIHVTLKELKKQGFTDIVYIQDDHYFIQHEKTNLIIQDALDFYKKNNYPIVYFGERFPKSNFISEEKITPVNVFEVYDSTKFPQHYYPYDDSPHIANIDFLLENLYNLSLTNFDVWNLEVRNANYFKTNKIMFASGRKPCCYCANFSGRSVARAIPKDEKIKFIIGEKINYDECKQFYQRLDE